MLSIVTNVFLKYCDVWMQSNNKPATQSNQYQNTGLAIQIQQFPVNSWGFFHPFQEI